MEEDEIEQLINRERKRLAAEAKEEKKLRREEGVRKFISIIAILILIGIVGFLVIKIVFPFVGDKIDDNNAAEAARIIAENEAARLAAEAEAARLAAELNANKTAEEERLLELARAEEIRMNDLKLFCNPLFENKLNNYQRYYFKTRQAAWKWLEEETIERGDKNKTFEERVDFQIRFAFINAKISAAKSVPLSTAVGDINSENFDERTGAVCTNEGLIEVVGDGKDNLLYQITMRREWV